MASPRKLYPNIFFSWGPIILHVQSVITLDACTQRKYSGSIAYNASVAPLSFCLIFSTFYVVIVAQMTLI